MSETNQNLRLKLGNKMMTSMTCKFALFSIAITAVLTILITVVGAMIHQQPLKAQNMTANNTAENNATMNDSDVMNGNQAPIRPPFASETACS